MSDDREEWRAVVGYEGLYEVSNLGRIRGLPKDVIKVGVGGRKPHIAKRNGRLLKTDIGSQGYPCIQLTKDQKQKAFRVHRLILDAFVGIKPTPKHVARHLDGNRANSVLDNLCWGTDQDNADDIVKYGKRWTAKLTEVQVLSIRELAANKVNQYEIAKMFNCTQAAVNCIHLRKTWKHL